MSDQLTYVYAMRNERNGYIKIGRSISPQYRERTLQSEEPEVTLLFAYVCRADAETMCHAEFSEYRLRGEWFALPDELVVVLEEMLQEHSEDACRPKVSAAALALREKVYEEESREIDRAQEYFRLNPLPPEVIH